MKEVIIAPSILSSDFSNLENDIKNLREDGAEYLHFDVMDGHFVPNISFGVPILKSIKNKVDLVIDVHLMITDPLKYYKDFVENGGNIITFHVEALKDDNDVINLINLIHKEKAKVGISIKPKTDVESILKFLPLVDLVLVMSVEPGFGGQEFIPTSLEKIKKLNEIKKNQGYNFLIEVDGGINDKTARLVREAGCDILVSGSYIFKAKDRKEAIRKLKYEWDF